MAGGTNWGLLLLVAFFPFFPKSGKQGYVRELPVQACDVKALLVSGISVSYDIFPSCSYHRISTREFAISGHDQVGQSFSYVLLPSRSEVGKAQNYQRSSRSRLAIHSDQT
jgi:hypothetical protein